MRFRVRRLGSGNWTVVPDSGKYKDVPVIHAELVSMSSVRFESRIATGILLGVWGATIIENGIFTDPSTLRFLGFGNKKPLQLSLPEPLTLDYDGYLNSNMVKCSVATRLLLVGDHIYAKGAE